MKNLNAIAIVVIVSMMLLVGVIVMNSVTKVVTNINNQTSEQLDKLLDGSY